MKGPFGSDCVPKPLRRSTEGGERLRRWVATDAFWEAHRFAKATPVHVIGSSYLSTSLGACCLEHGVIKMETIYLIPVVGAFSAKQT